MASSPVRRKLKVDVEKAGGWDAVVQRVESGETVAAIARTFGVSRGFFTWMMYRWGDERGEDMRSRIAEARKLAADAMLEEAKDIADDADISSREALQKDMNRANIRVTIAGKLAPEKYGERRGGDVNIVSLGDLHIDALRARAVQRDRLLLEAPTEVTDP